MRIWNDSTNSPWIYLVLDRASSWVSSAASRSRYNMPTIVHFEIPADDVERSKKFYSDLFGWKIEKFTGQTGGGEDMDYWMITTTDDKGNKALGGGIMKRQGPQQPIINHIDVKSVDEYSKKVQQLGGKVHVPKTAVPGMGYFAICLDTENNAFGIWETNEKAK